MHDSQRLAGLLHALQDTNCCEGFEALANHSRYRNRRTLYRWRRSFGTALRIVPSFSLERLGLEHLHLVITKPRRQWWRFPYAVEQSWLTADFAESALYLHCLVPRTHKGLLQSLLRECQTNGWCAHVTASWSGSGWQEITNASNGNPPLDVPLADNAPVMRACPLIVPVFCESWNNPQSCAAIWTAVSSRIGGRLRDYLPRGRIYHVNGRMHVRHAFDVLNKEGLFRQYLVRYEGWQRDSIEVFVFLRTPGDWLAELCEALRPETIALETYHGDTTAVLRIVGHEGLLRQLLRLQEELRSHHASVHLRTMQEAKERVRFCYELVFDPKSAEWVFPHDQIIKHMNGDLR